MAETFPSLELSHGHTIIILMEIVEFNFIYEGCPFNRLRFLGRWFTNFFAFELIGLEISFGNFNAFRSFKFRQNLIGYFLGEGVNFFEEIVNVGG